MTELTHAVLDRIIDAFNAHDVDTLVDAFTDEGEFLLASGPDIWGTRLKGKAQIRAALQKRFADTPDIQWSEGRNWIFGQKALSEWRVTATLPDGGKLDQRGCDLWEFEGDRIARKDTYYKQVIR